VELGNGQVAGEFEFRGHADVDVPMLWVYNTNDDSITKPT